MPSHGCLRLPTELRCLRAAHFPPEDPQDIDTPALVLREPSDLEVGPSPAFRRWLLLVLETAVLRCCRRATTTGLVQVVRRLVREQSDPRCRPDSLPQSPRESWPPFASCSWLLRHRQCWT